MTELTLEPPGDHLFVRSIGDRGIRVGDDWHAGSLIISAQRLIEGWAPETPSGLSAEHFAPVIELGPSIVLLGTGSRQEIITPERLAPLLRQGIGVEVMTTGAACRTFNVLAAEGREVVAALLPLRAA
mgnify:CR=1 FL=1